MPLKTIMIAVVAGSLAILLGLWDGLDRLIDELRAMTPLGMLQPVVPTRNRTSVTRQARLCFIASGAAVILFALYGLLRGH